MIPTTSQHTATLEVAVSGNPAEKIFLTGDPNGRAFTFVAHSTVSPAAAQARIIKFLEDSLAAAKAPAPAGP